MMKETYMSRRYAILPVFLLFLASCTNPILKWIGDFPIDTKDIIRFSLGVSGENIQIGDSPDENGRIPILVIVPPTTNLNQPLSPVIFHDGASVSGPGFTVPGGVRTVKADTGVKFEEDGNSVPRIYTVRAENGSTAEYIVTVLYGQNPNPAAFDDDEKIIVGFYFINPLAVGTIDQDKHHITVTVPFGTNLSALVPTLYYKGASLDPPSGARQDFGSLQGYTVFAKDGTSRLYTVEVIVKLSGAKDIVDFSFSGVTVSKTVIGAIPGPDGKTPISVMVAGRPDLAGLIPTIKHTGVKVDLAPGSFRNFISPVTYRVTAQDETTKDYEVTVYFADSAKIITGFSFNYPTSEGNKQILGQINQAGHVIEVAVPSSDWSKIDSLNPTIDYYGASIAYAGTSHTPLEAPNFQRGNPFLDNTPHRFKTAAEDPIIYTVMGTDGSTQDYQVLTVEEAAWDPDVSVRFEPIKDPAGLLIKYNFNRTTGLVTFDASTPSGYTPYEWYLNEALCPDSGIKTTLILQTKDLGKGRHKVVLVVTGSDNKHYTTSLYFTVE
jgi:hypothetical protein